MYSGCDTLSLRILFVYFLALPSLLHPSILFYTCIIIVSPSLVEVDYKDQVIPEDGNAVGGWHGDDEGKYIINESVECQKY